MPYKINLPFILHPCHLLDQMLPLPQAISHEPSEQPDILSENPNDLAEVFTTWQSRCFAGPLVCQMVQGLGNTPKTERKAPLLNLCTSRNNSSHKS